MYMCVIRFCSLYCSFSYPQVCMNYRLWTFFKIQKCKIIGHLLSIGHEKHKMIALHEKIYPLCIPTEQLWKAININTTFDKMSKNDWLPYLIKVFEVNFKRNVLSNKLSRHREIERTYLVGLGGGASDFFFIWPVSPRSAGVAGVTSSSMLRSVVSWIVTLHTDTQEGCRTV